MRVAFAPCSRKRHAILNYRLLIKTVGGEGVIIKRTRLLASGRPVILQTGFIWAG